MVCCVYFYRLFIDRDKNYLVYTTHIVNYYRNRDF